MIWPLRPGNSLKGRVIHGLLVFPSGMASLNFWSLTCDMAGNLYANSWTKTYLTGASFFSPGARPSFYGRLNGECYDHGVVENSISQWRNAVVGQSSRSRKHSSRPNLSEPWFFLGTGGTLLRPIRQCGVDFGSWFCAGPSQSRKTWLAPWQHWGMWLQRWTLLCHKQWQIWRVHLYLIVDQQYRFHPVDLGIYLLKWGENWETP